MAGTGWRTLDLHGFTRALKDHELHAGVHYDGFTLKSRRYSTADWLDGSADALSQESLGQTRTFAIWGEDQWMFAPSLMLTLGARYEWWKAFSGRNFSASPGSTSINRAGPRRGCRPRPRCAGGLPRAGR